MHKLSESTAAAENGGGGSRERRQGPGRAAGLFRPCHLADNPPVFVYFEEMITIIMITKI